MLDIKSFMFSRFKDYRVLESYRVLQYITEYYRVFLAHLLGPISGLVFSIDVFPKQSSNHNCVLTEKVFLYLEHIDLSLMLIENKSG